MYFGILVSLFLLVGSSLPIWMLLLQNPPDWQEILTHFRGSELQNYFTRILEDNLKVQSQLGCLYRVFASSTY